MPITISVPGYLRAFTGGQPLVELDLPAGTVADLLDALWHHHPGIRDRVVTEQGELRPHMNLFVGVESIRFTGGMATPVDENAEVMIVPAVSGG